MSKNWLSDDDEEEFKPWTLAQIYDDLVGFGDICRELDITTFRLDKWIKRRERIHSPLPIKRVGATDIYSLQEWKDWYAAWLAPGKKGRRPDSKWVQAKPYGSGKPFFTFEQDFEAGPDD